MLLYRGLVLKKIEMITCNIVTFTLHKSPIVKLEMSNADLFNESASTMYDSPLFATALISGVILVEQLILDVIHTPFPMEALRTSTANLLPKRTLIRLL